MKTIYGSMWKNPNVLTIIHNKKSLLLLSKKSKISHKFYFLILKFGPRAEISVLKFECYLGNWQKNIFFSFKQQSKIIASKFYLQNFLKLRKTLFKHWKLYYSIEEKIETHIFKIYWRYFCEVKKYAQQCFESFPKIINFGKMGNTARLFLVLLD